MTWNYPTDCPIPFVELGDTLQRTQLIGMADSMKPVLMAQWAIESGWGKSALARKHLNYAGAKWRDMMKSFATSVSYNAHDGKALYCHFADHENFIRGYFHRLDHLGPYDGWRDHAAKSGADFIRFIGPIWLGQTQVQNQQYVQKVLSLAEQRFDL